MRNELVNRGLAGCHPRCAFTIAHGTRLPGPASHLRALFPVTDCQSEYRPDSPDGSQVVAGLLGERRSVRAQARAYTSTATCNPAAPHTPGEDAPQQAPGIAQQGQTGTRQLDNTHLARRRLAADGDDCSWSPGLKIPLALSRKAVGGYRGAALGAGRLVAQHGGQGTAFIQSGGIPRG